MVVITAEHLREAKLRVACADASAQMVGRDVCSLSQSQLAWIEKHMPAAADVATRDMLSDCGATVYAPCLWACYGYGYGSGSGSGDGDGDGLRSRADD